MPFEFPSNIKHLLQATPLSLTGRSGDKLAWAENLKGSFDLKSAYKLDRVVRKLHHLQQVGFGKLRLFLTSKLSYGNVLTIALLSKNVSQEEEW